ncbi:4-alpha-glucanotransferase [Bradyrhizobium sp. WD16]|uniref:4-alpha-glucanotransferase n=1 Tax=Bradyrhizobium sp. WD16 TaxID=1521768 RepID=UPI0020A3AD33|nr:4-alpha-glucanotransferase [Bradyrhizobium sp. WD16]UTD30028.1 4-alpha-glucanotransferase [Bradyrhizobium sp. WD16]
MDLSTRAAELGLEREFYDAWGERRVLSEAALTALIEAIPAPTPHPLLKAPLVIRDGDASADALGEPAAFPLRWTLHCGDAEICGGLAEHRPVPVPTVLAPDVYRLDVTDRAGLADSRAVIVAPRRAFAGRFHRTWVLTLQLYSLRSERNWGIGDFSDLADVVRLAARAGAGGVGLNPLHALFDDHPTDCSPYSPNSRSFLNPIYVDAARAPGLPEGFAAGHADRLDALRAEALVDYGAVADLKWQALRAAFAAFPRNAAAADRAEFDGFRAERGELLAHFACFEWLRRRHGGPWWEWPQEWRRPDTARLAELRQGRDGEEIAYFEFIQWLADRQLRECSEVAAALRMPVGLYLDVAVGVKADGFDAWHAQDAISRQASVGAPPDLLNTAGQNWGLAGFSATGLDRALYRPFRDMMAASMRYAGAIRLDHVLWLQRFYLIPSGFAASEGSYVRMPLEALLAVTALESARHQCIVIGEDLGTVPEGFRDRLADHGIWSYQVMIFERQYDGAFKPPEHYPANALVTFGTHDLPTFAGWMSGHDLAVKHGLSIDPGESEGDRNLARDRLGAAVHKPAADIELEDVLAFLDRTPSRLLAVAVEDLLQLRDQVNVPGTIDEHPNWRRKLPADSAALAAVLDPEQLRRVLASRAFGSPS